MKPLAITGVGLVSPIGLGFPAFRAALAEPSDAAFRRESSVLAKEKLPDAIAAEVYNFDPTPFLGSKGLRNHDRLTLFLLVAAKQALEDSGLKQNGAHAVYTADRVGICSATAYGSLDSIDELVSVAELQDPRFVNPNRFPNTVINSSAGYVSIWEDLRAPNVTIVDGNCGALDAVLTSETHLVNGRADAFLVGGGESLSDSLYLAFRKLGVLADGTRAYAPGRDDGEGMRLGEASAYFAIETEPHAQKRDAKRYGAVIGYGNAFEPPESEAAIVHASARAVRRTIEMALRDAKLEPGAISAVCGSFNGLAGFDRAERAAIAEVLGPDVPVAAPKTLYGETFGASGALGMATALAWLAGAPFGPRVSGREPASIDRVLVLSVGFYGNVSALVITR
jgi:3-oxoacyl-(acyl-carrier-protein) synthase